jgi:hypothetical protein
MCRASSPRIQRKAAAGRTSWNIRTPGVRDTLLLGETTDMLKIDAYVPLFARLLLCSLFIWSGSLTLMNPAGTVQYIASNGIPAPNVIVWVVVGIELAGRLAVLYRLRIMGRLE